MTDEQLLEWRGMELKVNKNDVFMQKDLNVCVLTEFSEKIQLLFRHGTYSVN